MNFSDFFEVAPETIRYYGAVDISLVCDIPLFIDPMLIFNSQKEEYQQLHKEIIKYFHFLSKKAQAKLSDSEIRAWFSFNEVYNNWLGYSLQGNRGSGLGWDYAKFLYKNIEFAIKTNNISKSPHIEKVMLLYEGSGKDKISDLTVNLIKRYLLEYTENFAKDNIDKKYCKMIPVEKTSFNYETQSFESKEYFLPCIINKYGKYEYVLLTPFDILREDEPSINRKDFYSSHERIRESLDNDILRTYVNNYISEAVRAYEEEQRKNKKQTSERRISIIEKEAFIDALKDFPELYDYYIKMRETEGEEIKIECLKEVNIQLAKLLENSRILIDKIILNGYQINTSLTAREEANKRISYFKHIIEDCDGYKCLYTNGKRIANENDLQRLFKFVWFDTAYKVNYEANNGQGQADIIVSKGAYNQNIVEFKLASNKNLAHVFKQVKIYEAANKAEGSLIAIFFFTQQEYDKTITIIKKAEHLDKIGNGIILIDCRNDNKKSASIA